MPDNTALSNEGPLLGTPHNAREDHHAEIWAKNETHFYRNLGNWEIEFFVFEFLSFRFAGHGGP